MSDELVIVGGTYFESCEEPEYEELFGSGLRGAAALSEVLAGQIRFISCIGKDDKSRAELICNEYEIAFKFYSNDESIGFQYYHPLSRPIINGEYCRPCGFTSEKIESQKILYYGMIEAKPTINGNYVVYDPQSHVGFRESGSTANHLAIILNKSEAQYLSGRAECNDLAELGQDLLAKEDAEVIVIKNGPRGALLIDHTGVKHISAYRTSSVWPIGSGDIFSAVFAWKWMLEGKSSEEAAVLASKFTATYCQHPNLPLSKEAIEFNEIPYTTSGKKIYLAGPFFSISERWLARELLKILRDFGNHVFSPMHEVGLVHLPYNVLQSKSIAEKDLQGLESSDLVVAVIDRLDAGTLFEIGYARARGKPVLAIGGNVSNSDQVMLVGSGCEVVADLSTAAYLASWKTIIPYEKEG